LEKVGTFKFFNEKNIIFFIIEIFFAYNKELILGILNEK